jgi:trimethylamine--corrinoid protein Co-methyltransferase
MSVKNFPSDPDRPQLRVLTKDKIEQIHQASLKVLSQTGVKVLLPEAVELMADAGCDVVDADLVKIPSRLVEECLDAAPSSITDRIFISVPARPSSM